MNHSREDYLEMLTSYYKLIIRKLSPIEQELIHLLALSLDPVDIKTLCKLTKDTSAKSISDRMQELERKNVIVRIPISKRQNTYEIKDKSLQCWYMWMITKRQYAKLDREGFFDSLDFESIFNNLSISA